MTSNESHTKEQVAALARGLSVFLAFGAKRELLTISQVAQDTGLTPASARRVLLTLKNLGYVEQTARRFHVTAKVLDLGYSYLSSQPVWQVVQPVLERLRHNFSMSINAAVLDGTDIVYIVRAPYRQIVSGLISTGTRHPAHLTAIGRVMLADLDSATRESLIARMTFKRLTHHSVTDSEKLSKIIDTVIRQNYSIVDQELEIGLRSIAVPIRDKSGNAIAAMNASGHSERIEMGFLINTVLPEMFKASEEITQKLQLRGRRSGDQSSNSSSG